MRSRASMAALLAASVAAITALSGTAAGKPAQPPPPVNLHDARYCEILELKGALPNARVVVWNTIGLNECPAQKWESFDAAALAAELGDAFVVLNGPRHFLMDSAKARIGEVRSFHGLRMRRVATLPIETAADLAQTPFAERIVNRVNTWHWKRGRRVYELLAPNGSTYVMQSYSQIVDPGLKMGDLRTLGDRLALPEGWRYRVRRLKEPLTLRAEGSATILQDDLKNTYQRTPAEDTSRRYEVDVTGITKSIGTPAPGMIEDEGTIKGRPFGSGTVSLTATFQPDQRMTGTFRIRTKRGSAFGTIDTTYVISGFEITFDGTATFTGGTGRYRGIAGKRLVAHDENTLDGQNGSLTLEGIVRF